MTNMQNNVVKDILEDLIKSSEEHRKNGVDVDDQVTHCLMATLDRLCKKELTLEDVDFMNNVVAIPCLYTGLTVDWWQVSLPDRAWAKAKYNTLRLNISDMRCTLSAIERMPFIASHTRDGGHYINVRLPDSGFIFSARCSLNTQTLLLRNKKGALISYVDMQDKKSELNEHILSSIKDHMRLLTNLGLMGKV